jgi:hypothetical protein
MPYSWRFGLAALGGVPRNTRDIRAADANIGKLTVAQARQFVQTAVIALPLLDEANECGKHSVLLSVKFRPKPVVDLERKIGMFPAVKTDNVALQLSQKRMALNVTWQAKIQTLMGFRQKWILSPQRS